MAAIIRNEVVEDAGQILNEESRWGGVEVWRVEAVRRGDKEWGEKVGCVGWGEMRRGCWQGELKIITLN